MVQGIETDDKKYKHKKRNDEKWLAKDMLVWKRYVERDIAEKASQNEKEKNISITKDRKKTFTPVRVLQILILGIFGPIILIGGLYMFMMDNSVVAIPLVLIGAVLVIALILNEIYKK